MTKDVKVFWAEIYTWDYMGRNEAVQTHQSIPKPTTTCRSCSLFHNARPALFGRLATGVEETVLHGSWSLQLLTANPGSKWFRASKYSNVSITWNSTGTEKIMENHSPFCINCGVISACADPSDPQNAQSTICLSLLTPLRRSGPRGEVDPQSGEKKWTATMAMRVPLPPAKLLCCDRPVIGDNYVE